MQASITIPAAPELAYLLRLADTCLISGQRLGEWCGHGPILEEDIALSNMALDLVGQARALLTLAGQQRGQGYDEDQLAFLRDEGDNFVLEIAVAAWPCTLVTHNLADFARGQLRVPQIPITTPGQLLRSLLKREFGSDLLGGVRRPSRTANRCATNPWHRSSPTTAVPPRRVPVDGRGRHSSGPDTAPGRW